MKNKVWVTVGLVILVLILGSLFFVGGRAVVAWILNDDKQNPPQNHVQVENDDLSDDGILKVQKGERTNVLLLGIDARKGEDDSRTDTMILVSADPKLKKIVVVSIPRDTRVDIRGAEDQKICAANVLGGVDLVKKEIEKLLHTDIDYYAKVNFESFEEIIDILGGITIDVEQRMYYPSPNPTDYIDLKPGVQKLNGQQALSYVRYRSYAMGDIDRTSHQQKFMKALTEEITKPASLLKIPKMLDVIKENLETDMSMNKMIQMASWASLFDADSIVTQTLPGYFLDIRDGYGNLLNSFWEADAKVAPHLIHDLYQGKTYPVVNEVGGKTEVAGGKPAVKPSVSKPSVQEPEEEHTDSGMPQKPGIPGIEDPFDPHAPYLPPIDEDPFDPDAFGGNGEENFPVVKPEDTPDNEETVHSSGIPGIDEQMPPEIPDTVQQENPNSQVQTELPVESENHMDVIPEETLAPQSMPQEIPEPPAVEIPAPDIPEPEPLPDIEPPLPPVEPVPLPPAGEIDDTL